MKLEVPGPAPGSSAKRMSLNCKTFLREHTGNIFDFYEVVGDLGEGGFADVLLARERVRAATPQECAGRNVAVKRVRKPNPVVGLDEEGSNSEEALQDFRTEVELMKSLDHPNICRLLQVFEDAKNIYLVIEHIEGGELFDRIIALGTFGEEDAIQVIHQVASALAYCHQHGIVHRDIKPENILLVNQEHRIASGEEVPIVVKVIDFGFGSRILQGARLCAKVGTFLYSAPEILKGEPCDAKMDMWALGCVLYEMLCGTEPFFGADCRNRIIQGLYPLGGEVWEDISPEAQALVSALLTVDPKQRISAADVLSHAWLVQRKHHARSPKKSVIRHLHRLKHLHTQNLFRNLCSGVVARQLDESSLRSLRDTFSIFDQNHDGIITLAEFKEAWRQVDLESFESLEVESPETKKSCESKENNSPRLPMLDTRSSVQLGKRFSTMDMDGDGLIDYTEFLAACIDRKIKAQEEVCWAAFRVFDVDGNGEVTYGEFQQVLNSAGMQEAFPEHVRDELWLKLTGGDPSKDAGEGGGKIDFDQFLFAVRGYHVDVGTDSENAKNAMATSNSQDIPPEGSTGLPIARRQSGGSCLQLPGSGMGLPIPKRAASCIAAPGMGLLPIPSRQG